MRTVASASCDSYAAAGFLGRAPFAPLRRAAAAFLCSVVVYELRHGAESSSDPRREHAKLDMFLAPFASLPFREANYLHDAVNRRVAGSTIPSVF